MIVRKFRANDVKKIQGLLKYTLAESAHFIRDQSFLKYCMRFPGASEDGIFIAEADNEIVGFAVVSIVEENWARLGRVVELQCMDLSSFSNLIQATIKYCASKNVDAIALRPPPLASISAVLRGWHKAERGVMMVRPISFLPLLRLLLLQDRLRKRLTGKTITLCIDDEAIKVTAKEVQVITVDGFETGDIRISLSSETLLGIMFSQLSPLFSWLSGKTKIKNITNVPLALKILNALKLIDSMYVSSADMI